MYKIVSKQFGKFNPHFAMSIDPKAKKLVIKKQYTE
jgi:hypothetical protein